MLITKPLGRQTIEDTDVQCIFIIYKKCFMEINDLPSSVADLIFDRKFKRSLKKVLILSCLQQSPVKPLQYII